MRQENNLVDFYRNDLFNSGYHRAEKALAFAASHHDGFRLDGSPEISHQIEIAKYLRKLIPFKGLERALIVTMLHDVREDYGVADCVIRALFGLPVASDVAHLTKVFRGVSLPVAYAFSMPARSPISAIVKGADRIHNLRTMDNAFSDEKKASYRLEARRYILPMLLKAQDFHRSHSFALGQIIRDLHALTQPAETHISLLKRISHDA